MRTLDDNSVDSIVTDPPYELGFMGKDWDRSGIANSIDMWREALRVLKPGGHLLAFSGARTYHRMTCAIEDAGFEVRDQIMWLYGSGFPKSHNLDASWAGWGTALKPAHEPICVARKPLAGTVAANMVEFSTGALNIDACRIPSEPMRQNTGAGRLPRRHENHQRSPGFVGQPHELGRWPANLIHDGSDEVLAAFPDAPGQMAKVSGTEPTANGFSGAVMYGGFIGRRESALPRIEADKSAARFFYCAKATRADRNEGCDELPSRGGGMNSNTSGQHITRRDGWEPEPVKNNHPTVKPTALMAYLCRLVTPPGGLVLDPFMGSGSTGKACMREGFHFIGIDMTPVYLEIARARITHELDRVQAEAPAPAQADLFEGVAA
ncbi:DNA-methyltransferase [Ralstonia wenshanensis]|uniref:DNA-methyltransferase n=1 Tax=Ralstonia wenshanensis TaxID=2842456 RepID=UPI003D99A128